MFKMKQTCPVGDEHIQCFHKNETFTNNFRKLKREGGFLMNRKYFIMMVIAFMIEFVLTYWIASVFSVRFIEVMFFTGAAFTLGTLYFTSSGGAMSRFFAAQSGAITGIIQERDRFQFKAGPVFIASLLFVLIGLVFFILLVTGIIPPQKI